MGLANNLNKFEWENEIPFSDAKVKNTLHALIGDSNTVHGLLVQDSDKLGWDLNCLNPEVNDTFGSYSFGQINSQFSVTVKKVDENNSHLRITISERQGAFISGNQAYLQAECDKFIKALTFYLEHQDTIEQWHNVIKPQRESAASEAANSSSSGCVYIALLTIIIGVVLYFVVTWLME